MHLWKTKYDVLSNISLYLISKPSNTQNCNVQDINILRSNKKWDKPIKQVMFCQFEYQIDDNLKTRTNIIQVSNMIKSCRKWLIRHQKCLQIKLTVNFLFLLPCVLHQKYGKKDRPIIIVVTVLPYLHHIFICII